MSSKQSYELEQHIRPDSLEPLAQISCRSRSFLASEKQISTMSSLPKHTESKRTPSSSSDVRMENTDDPPAQQNPRLPEPEEPGETPRRPSQPTASFVSSFTSASTTVSRRQLPQALPLTPFSVAPHGLPSQPAFVSGPIGGFRGINDNWRQNIPNPNAREVMTEHAPEAPTQAPSSRRTSNTLPPRAPPGLLPLSSQPQVGRIQATSSFNPSSRTSIGTFQAVLNNPRKPHQPRVMVLAYPCFNMLSVAGALQAFEPLQPFECAVVAPGEETVSSIKMSFLTTFTFDAILQDDPLVLGKWDVLVIPDGDPVDNGLVTDETSMQITEIARRFTAARSPSGKDRYLLAMGRGAFFLAGTSLFAGRIVTTSRSLLANFVQLCDTYAVGSSSEKAIVMQNRWVDGSANEARVHLVTTSGGTCAIDGALRVLGEIMGFPVAVESARVMDHFWNCNGLTQGYHVPFAGTRW